MVEIESANFWRESPEIERGELKTEEIETEVFFFPRPVTRKRKAHSQTRSDFCNGAKKQSIPRAIVGPTHGSCISSRCV